MVINLIYSHAKIKRIADSIDLYPLNLYNKLTLIPSNTIEYIRYKKMRFNTSLLHAGVQREINGSTLPPVYQTSAFEQDTAADLEKIFENKNIHIERILYKCACAWADFFLCSSSLIRSFCKTHCNPQK